MGPGTRKTRRKTMKKVYYYTPIIENLGRPGTKLFAIKATTKFWATGDKNKVEVYTTGPDPESAVKKLTDLIAGGAFPAEELPVNYFLCGADVVKRIKPLMVSKPLNRYGEEAYIAALNFPEVEAIWKSFAEDEQPDEFWADECVDGLMDVSDARIKKLKRDGLFNWLCDEIGMSKNNNVAMSIYKIARQEGLTPVELFNKLAE